MRRLLFLLVFALVWCAPLPAANEIVYNSPGLTGSTLYAVAEIAYGEASSGNWWNGSAYATPTTTRGDFDLAMTETAGVGQFKLSLPTAAGFINRSIRVLVFVQAGGSPSAAADGEPVAEFTGYWNGTIFATNVNALGSSAQSALDLQDFADAGYDPTDNLARAEAIGINETTIASAPTATTITLTAGPPDNSALVRCLAVFTDASDPLQRAVVPVTAYTASTKTVTLHTAPAFTLTAGDQVFFIPDAFSIADVIPYEGSQLEEDIDDIAGGMGAATAVFDNARVVQKRIVTMVDRNDGTSVGNKPVVMRVGEKFKVWLDMEEVIGDGVWVTDADNPESSSPLQLVVTEQLGVNRELVVVELTATNAIVGATYTVTCDVEGTPGETIVAKFDVQMATD